MMAIFTAAGRDWELVLDLGSIGRLRETVGFDFNVLAGKPGALAEFFADPNRVLLTAWQAVHRQHDSATLAEFIVKLDHDALRGAFMLAVVEFLPECDDAVEEKEKPAADHDRRGLWVERVGWELAGLCGVDGTRLTLRQLVWMAAERKRAMGELAAWHVSQIVARIPFGGAAVLDPLKINPYRVERPKSAALLALEKWKAEAAWKFRMNPNN